ncbi:hypothetical protein D3C80_1257980 [compost metagenome]
MANRFGQAVVPGEPLSAEAVQGTDVPPPTFQARAEEFTEQRLEAIPGHAVLGVDPVDRQVFSFHALKQFTSVEMTGDGHGHGGVESTEDRQRFGHFDQFVRQVRHDFFTQIALQVAGAPDQIIEHRAGRGAVFEHDDDQLQTRRPAAGEVMDKTQLIGIDLVGTQVLFDESARLGQVERQLGAFDFNHLIHDPQARQA